MQRWPTKLWIVRHGESAGNVARDAAHAAGGGVINIDARDVDVPLSQVGERQANALGRWFGSLPPGERPNVVLSSPYLRAQTTAKAVQVNGGLAPDFGHPVIDERLREKEFGILDRLARLGIEHSAIPNWLMRAAGSGSSISGLRPVKAGATSSCGSAACSIPSACTTTESAC